MTFPEDVGTVLDELRTMLIEKNTGYGNSALEPVRIFSKADNLEQIRVRIDDKLSRIMRGNGVIKEDTIFDLMGYLVLLRVAQRREQAAIRIETHCNAEKLCGCGDELQTSEDMKSGKCGICRSLDEHIHVDIEQPAPKAEQNQYLAKRKRPELKTIVPAHLRNTDIFIPKFEYDRDLKKFFENIFFWELPDGRVVLEYGQAHYYSTKEKILSLPYPPPVNYYDSIWGWNSTNEQAAKKYRKYLAEQDEKADRGYKFKLGTDTKANHGEDYEKIEGELAQ